MHQHYCLFCNAPLRHQFVDLGTCPPSNAFLTPAQLDQPETVYPLQAFVCDQCFLVQGPLFKRPQDIFNYDYAYHSSWSPSWVEHARHYVHKVVERFSLDEHSYIVEVGSNDGYLLQHALALGIPCLGIDPSAGAASIAQTKGIFTITNFFTTELAEQLVQKNIRADLLCGINVFAHVPDINNFVEGMRILLKPQGVITMEFPHLLCLINDVQFDTIYHEHYFYYSLSSVQRILAAHGLRIFDVEELPTHGGSLRIYVCHEAAAHTEFAAVRRILATEDSIGMNTLDYYLGFQKELVQIRMEITLFLLKNYSMGKKVAGYGAAAKGNTMINYLGINKDMLPFVVDASPAKQGKFMPGSRIPVVSEESIRQYKPEYVVILPWNLKEEISHQLKYIREWGGKFVTAIPRLCVW